MSVERPPSLFAGVEPLEVFVELLADLDTTPPPPSSMTASARRSAG